MTTETQQRILDAVDAGFDAQLATTKDFVAIPSTRGAEGPCQDMIGDLLRQRGYEVDDWHIDLEDLKDLRGYGPIQHDFSKARSVVGTYRPTTTRIMNCLFMPSAFRCARCWAGRNPVPGCSTASSGRRR